MSFPLHAAPKDGTYIKVMIGSRSIRNVYWCDDANAWAEGGRVFFPALPSSSVWELMEEPVRAYGRKDGMS